MKTINVVAAVINSGGKFFATQRGYGEFKGGWEFPGGKIEDGESPEEALIREIKEELGCGISVDDFVCNVEYDYPEFHLSMKCYLCSIANGSPTLLEHSDAKWLSKNELWSVDWLPADVSIVEKIPNIGSE